MCVLTRAVSNSPSFQFSHNHTIIFMELFTLKVFYRCLEDYNNFDYGQFILTNNVTQNLFTPMLCKQWQYTHFQRNRSTNLKRIKNGSIPVTPWSWLYVIINQKCYVSFNVSDQNLIFLQQLIFLRVKNMFNKLPC